MKARNTEEFLDQVRKIGVSEKFIKMSRSSVDRVFNEVPEDKVEECLDTLYEVFATQAELENACKKAN